MAFREKDYLRRQLAELARVFARVLDLREAGETEEARAEFERGAALTLGVGYVPLSGVHVPTAPGLLRTREGAEAYAQLLECDAELDDRQGRTGRARALRERARGDCKEFCVNGRRVHFLPQGGRPWPNRTNSTDSWIRG